MLVSLSVQIDEEFFFAEDLNVNMQNGEKGENQKRQAAGDQKNANKPQI